MVSDEQSFNEFARAVYWFSTLFIYEIVLSSIYKVENKKIVSKKTGKFIETGNYLIVFVSLGGLLYILDAIVSEPALTILSILGNSLIPILFSIIFFDIFYVSKFIIGRSITSKYPVVSLGIGIVGIIVAIVMYLI